MKKLIKKILKESVDNRIVDMLIKLKLTNVKEIEEFLKETEYDENEIKEIYSIYFKTITGSDLTPSNWMNYYFSPDQLEIVTSEKYPNSVFFRKNGKVVMEQNKENRYFYFDYEEFWLFFESVFSMEYEQRQEVLSYWLEETLKLKDYIPQTSTVSQEMFWRRLSN